MQNISVNLDRGLLKKLDDLAEETERSRAWLLNKAVECYLEELEDLKVAKERLHDKRLSLVKPLS
ncbi:MAG: ribbon-helix-helix protein, CopG family [Deltaproteobacteria bacterium]|nr:ribbon-helix-helix protein, CopG family [Deltaproteobacteria bacterium]